MDEVERLTAEIRQLQEERDRLRQEVALWRTRYFELARASKPKAPADTSMSGAAQAPHVAPQARSIRNPINPRQSPGWSIPSRDQNSPRACVTV
ncbi:MAG: hypothetical protein HY716_08065 [Planctomycetes bacterium]|nr:hypothetical protein [Planctomycetota bacterium]